MKKLIRTTLTLASCYLCLTLTACTTPNPKPMGNPEMPYPPIEKPRVGDIYYLPTGTKLNAKQFLGAATNTRIVYVGETHDNPASHRLELEVLKAMEERYPHHISLGMEMFNTGQQKALDEWTAGKLTEKEFLRKSAWYDNWSMDFAYYRDILDYAREKGIRVVGLNAPRKTVRAVSMHKLDKLPKEIRAQLPEMDFSDPYQKAMAKAIFAGHGQGKKYIESFLRVQTLWDETMAQNVVRAMTEAGSGQHMMVMAGGNHVRYGFGIPRRVYRRMPTSYVLVGSSELNVPKEKRDRLMDVEMPRFPMPPLDYVVYTKYESLPGGKVKLGVAMKEVQGRVVVESVAPGSTANAAGVLKGDVILALDKVAIVDSFDLIYEVNRHVSGDKSVLTIERKGEQLKLDLTFAPPTEKGVYK